jgi:hypothetical protein
LRDVVDRGSTLHGPQLAPCTMMAGEVQHTNGAGSTFTPPPITHQVVHHLGQAGAQHLSGPGAALPVLGADTAQIARMEEAMAQVLDQHVSTRKVMRHLGYLERALQKQGAQCFVDLPLQVLRPALIQLKSVMGPEPSQGLTELHACLVVMVVEREMPQDSGDMGLLSVFNVDDRLLVTEISHADFMSADQAWSRQEETAS